MLNEFKKISRSIKKVTDGKKPLHCNMVFILLVFILINDCHAEWRSEIVEIFGRPLAKFISANGEHVFQYFGMAIVLMFFKSVSWTKLTLGAFLSLIGVIFPNSKGSTEQKGEAKLDTSKIKMAFKGGLRFALIIAGMVIIIASIYEGIVLAQIERNPIISSNSSKSENVKPVYRVHSQHGFTVTSSIDGILSVVDVDSINQKPFSVLLIGDKIIQIDTVSVETVKSMSMQELAALLNSSINKLLVDRNGTVYFITTEVRN